MDHTELALILGEMSGDFYSHYHYLVPFLLNTYIVIGIKYLYTNDEGYIRDELDKIILNQV